MTAADALDRGRESFGQQAWGDAFALLSAADQESPLEAEDLQGPTQGAPRPRRWSGCGPTSSPPRGSSGCRGRSGCGTARRCLGDGRVMDMATVLWCTGFRPDLAWVDLPVFDPDGIPRHHRGVVGFQPGLYFLGLWFLSGFTSSLLGGVGRDTAAHIAQQIAARHPDGRSAAEVLTAARHDGQPD